VATFQPYRIDVPQRELDDLRERLRRTRWPDRETVDDWAQGVPQGFLQDLATYWLDGYDWRGTEARINHRTQVMAALEDVDIHVLHVRSRHPDALPIVITHGWPGSFLEFERLIDPLVDPTSHGGSAEDAFHVVCPSLPGYGFSGKPRAPGWGIDRIADAWVRIMTGLGYRRFGAQGGDWGTSISTRIAQRWPDNVVGIHLTPPLAAPDPSTFHDLSAAESDAIESMRHGAEWEDGYSLEQATKPQTIGYALVDSPVGLLAWIVEKLVSWTDCDGDLSTVLSRDQVLDNVMLYWLNSAGASSARLYWESFKEVQRWFTAGTDDVVEAPTAGSIFPGEGLRPSRRWAEKRFRRIVHWNELARGGHFAAWEQPELMVDEIRSAFRAIRSAR
jgi:epoxide hydrolase